MHWLNRSGLYISSDVMKSAFAFVKCLWLVYQQRSNKTQCMRRLHCYGLYISSDLVKSVYALVKLL